MANRQCTSVSLQHLPLALLLLALAIGSSAARAQEPAAPTETEPDTEEARRERAAVLYTDGVKLVEEDEFAAAYEKFQAASELVAAWPNAHYNAGRCAYFAGKFAQALPHFLRLKELEPSGWDARENLIRVYQALGKLEERDAERQQLFDAFAKTEDEEYRKRNQYQRDELVHDGRRVAIYEVFVPEAPKHTTFRAQIPPARENEERRMLTMESLDVDTDVARELHIIGPEKRRYSIDGYAFGGARHTNFLMASEAWTYDEFRKILISILEGKGPEPKSQSGVATPPGK